MGLGWMAEEAEAEAGLSGKGIQRGSKSCLPDPSLQISQDPHVAHSFYAIPIVL